MIPEQIYQAFRASHESIYAEVERLVRWVTEQRDLRFAWCRSYNLYETQIEADIDGGDTTITFPAWYLWEPAEKAVAHEAELRERARMAAAAVHAKWEAQEREKRHELFLKLKEEFEP